MADPQAPQRPRRNCPKCGRTMYRPRSREIEIDRCLQCDLAWFDAGELEAWRARGRGVAAAEPLRFVAADGAEPLRCPACVADTLRMGSVGSSLVHRCDRCGGFLAHHRPGEGLELGIEASFWALFQLA
jgi:Zn-finger nucleic acid-binding protein